ncbi:unnamed protein product, partial [Ectocarpus sp. 12 AP-2014]
TVSTFTHAALVRLEIACNSRFNLVRADGACTRIRYRPVAASEFRQYRQPPQRDGSCNMCNESVIQPTPIPTPRLITVAMRPHLCYDDIYLYICQTNENGDGHGTFPLCNTCRTWLDHRL